MSCSLNFLIKAFKLYEYTEGITDTPSSFSFYITFRLYGRLTRLSLPERKNT